MSALRSVTVQAQWAADSGLQPLGCVQRRSSRASPGREQGASQSAALRLKQELRRLSLPVLMKAVIVALSSGGIFYLLTEIQNEKSQDYNLLFSPSDFC